METQRIRVGLIDDNYAARELIKEFIKEMFPNRFEVVAEGHSRRSGIAALRTTAIDILFLDMDLGDGLGFDVLDALDNINFG